MFGTVLISVVSVMHAYVFFRIASVPMVKRHVSRKALILAGVALWAVFYLGRAYGRNGTGFPAQVLELAGMNWMGTLFLVFVPLIAVDVATGFGFMFPRIAPALRGAAAFAGCAMAAIALVQGARPPAVLDYEVRLPGLPASLDGTVVVALSAMHLGSLNGEKWLEKRVSQVNECNPGMVVLLGDILEGHGVSRDRVLPAFKRFSAPLGVWAGLGNHEAHGRQDRNVSLLEEAGITLLRDRWSEARPGLVVAGVDDLTRRRRSGQVSGLVTAALSGRPQGATILLSHTPWQAEEAALTGAGLMLCGHTHGGQIWPFGFLVKQRYPLIGGRYDVDGMAVIVCRGTGTWGPKMRLWRRGEILRITLRRIARDGEGELRVQSPGRYVRPA